MSDDVSLTINLDDLSYLVDFKLHTITSRKNGAAPQWMPPRWKEENAYYRDCAEASALPPMITCLQLFVPADQRLYPL